MEVFPQEILMVNLDLESDTLREEAVRIRRNLHRHPELGFEENRTSGIVADFLRKLDLDIKTGVGKTGVVGELVGAPGDGHVLVRVDMDALPIQEETEAEYASEVPGVMHACGHDGHTTIGLMAAKLLSRNRDRLRGKITLVFQPAEEGLGGARAMLDDGLLTSQPARALAVHLWNGAPLGKVAVTSGPVLASADGFKILICGKGGHGAVPHLANDVIVAASQMITAFQTVTSRSVDPMETAVLSVGQMSAGNAANVLPERAHMTGTIRTYRKEVRELVVRRMKEIGDGIAAAMGVEFELELTSGTPPVVNDQTVTKIAQRAATNMFGPENVDQGHRIMASEDMSLILEKIPGCYIFLGSANSDKGLDYPHHHPKFDFDEDALMLGARLLAQTAVDCLE
jgi:amidohydrolase